MKNKEREAFSERLNSVLKERYVRQTDLVRLCTTVAKQYGIELNKVMVSRWCNAQYIPRQDHLMIISKALSINPAWLMGIEGAEKYMDYHLKAEKNYEVIKEELNKLDENDMAEVKKYLEFLVWRKS